MKATRFCVCVCCMCAMRLNIASHNSATYSGYDTFNMQELPPKMHCYLHEI